MPSPVSMAARSVPRRERTIERPDLKAPPQAWLDRGAALEAAHPGSQFEQKPRGFGLHFRLAPEAGPAIHAALSGLVANSEDFWLMPGHMMWEVRPRGVDKGDAVARLMQDAAVSRPPAGVHRRRRHRRGRHARRPFAGRCRFAGAGCVRRCRRRARLAVQHGGRGRLGCVPMKLSDFKVLSFDCYGTLIDWETGILTALRPLARRAGDHSGRRGNSRRVRHAGVGATGGDAGHALRRSVGASCTRGWPASGACRTMRRRTSGSAPRSAIGRHFPIPSPRCTH